MDEVGRAWDKLDKYLEMFGGNVGIKMTALVVRNKTKWIFCT
jgi:hypothetical protein